jgi:hypothetical protein
MAIVSEELKGELRQRFEPLVEEVLRNADASGHA